MGLLNGISISTNINATMLQFDKLIEHINTSLKQPFNLDLNINQIQQQLTQITKQTEQFKTALNNSTSNKSLINSTETTKQGNEIKQTIEQIKEQLLSLKNVATVKINSSDINQATKNMNSFTATVTKATGEIEKLKYAQSGQRDSASRNGTATPIYSQSKISNVVDNTSTVQAKQLLAEENALIERETSLLTENISLMTKEYELTNEISVAQQKGLSSKVEELTLQRQINSAKLESSNDGLTNVSKGGQASIVEAENALLRQQMLIESSIGDKQNINTGKIEGQIALYQGRMNPQIDALLVKMKALGMVDTSGIERYRAELNSISSSSFNKGEMTQQFNNLKASANSNISTMQNLNKETKGFMGTLGSSAVKMGQFMLSGALVMGIVTAFKTATSSVIELDNGMNALRIDMMRANDNVFKTMSDGALDLSLKLGTNIKDITDVMAVYSNANSSAKEVLAKTAPSAILSNISGMSG